MQVQVGELGIFFLVLKNSFTSFYMYATNFGPFYSPGHLPKPLSPAISLLHTPLSLSFSSLYVSLNLNRVACMSTGWCWAAVTGMWAIGGHITDKMTPFLQLPVVYQGSSGPHELLLHP